MKNLIVFNSGDKPSALGTNFTCKESVIEWATSSEVKKYLPNPKIEGSKLTFDVKTNDIDEDSGEPKIRRGFALISQVPDDFIPA